MLNDRVLRRTTSPAGTDRREHVRAACPAEVTVAWHHEPSGLMRHEVVDISEGGLRIRSTAPLLQGMTGTAISLLPEGRRLDQPVMVAWVRRDDETDSYEIGLRSF